MLRRLGKSDLLVHPIGLGLWPIAGMTSLEVSEADSRETIEAALNCGLNFFDTAYCYGVDGISERLLGEVARKHRDQMVLATKGGLMMPRRGGSKWSLMKAFGGWDCRPLICSTSTARTK
jgi:aryl-alcohol dehydrogenase-like predicted oxidoreductase